MERHHFLDDWFSPTIDSGQGIAKYKKGDSRAGKNSVRVFILIYTPI